MKRIVGIFLVLVIGVYLAACGKTDAETAEEEMPWQGEAMEITLFSFTHTGTSTEECFLYSAEQTGEGIRLYTEELFSGGLIVDTIVDEPILEQLGEIAGKYGLDKWDGFDKSKKHVMDGSNFSLSVTLADGRTISAHGSNSFPDGYGDAKKEICELFENLIDKYESPAPEMLESEKSEEGTNAAEGTEATENINEVNILQVMIADNYLDEWSESETGIWDESVIRLCSSSWQSIVLGEESREKYPKLAEQLDQRNEENRVIYQNFMEQNVSLAKEHYTDTPEYFYEYSSNSSYSVQRADNLILSIREDGNEYTGGAHGMYGVWGINYDPATGEELPLADVCIKVEELPAILSQKVIENYADEYETFESLQSILETYKPEDYNWTMGYQGITFYFNPYEIASYAMGIIKVTLWFDENPELFNEKFFEKPNTGYVMDLPLNDEVEIDLNNGRKDKLRVSAYYETAEDEEYGVRHLCVTLNDISYQEEEYYGYDFYPSLVCVNGPEKEQYFLYVQEIAENDYSSISIYDLNGEEIKLKDRLSGVGFCGVWDEDAGEYGTYYNCVFGNPQEFELGTRMEILGTWTGERLYSIDPEKGIPKPATEYFTISNGWNPTVSQIPLEVTMLPEETKEELPAGTEFYFIRTDGESYVDARLPDGRECRIMVEFEDYMQTINGVDQWECFENLMYAG